MAECPNCEQCDCEQGMVKHGSLDQPNDKKFVKHASGEIEETKDD